MKRFIEKHIILFVLLAFSHGFAQEGFITTSRNMQFINPSFHGINMVSKAGVNYSRFNYGAGTSYIDNKYLYGNFAFEEMNFSIGLDVNSFSLTNLGLSENQVDLSLQSIINVSFLFFPARPTIGSQMITRGD